VIVVREAVAIALCMLGAAVNLTGVVGIVRMPDVYTRIQCASKTITMGAIPLLVALVVIEGPMTTYGSRALIVGGLLMLVNPAASHALGRAAYKTGVPMWSGAVADEPAARRTVAAQKQRS
jgi:multicomponent Na+:H+ antiporter subunit G